MSKQFVFFYLFKADPKRLVEVVPAHREYWDDVGPTEYTGGPFADRDGGMIIFSAGSLEEAEKNSAGRPFRCRGDHRPAMGQAVGGHAEGAGWERMTGGETARHGEGETR